MLEGDPADLAPCCSRKFNVAAIDINSYRSWLASRPSTTSTATSSDNAQAPYINGDIRPNLDGAQPIPPPINVSQLDSASSFTTSPAHLATSPTLPTPVPNPYNLMQLPTHPTFPPTPLSSTLTAQPAPSPSPATPNYPPNFASLISLIVSNQPIPDIQIYPDDLNPLSTTALHAKTPVPIRRKPWEIVRRPCRRRSLMVMV